RGVKYLAYLAQLALDKDRRLVGGRWTGPRMSGPDFAFGALYDEFEDVQIDDHIHANRLIRFSLVQKIYEQSILTAGPDGKRPGRGTVRVSSVLSDDQDDLLVAEDSGAAARISRGRLLHLYGRLGARSAARADRLNCDVGAAKPARAGDPHAFSLPLDEARRPGSRFLVIDATTEIEDRKGTHVRCALLERDGATVARFERVIRPYVF
ncbi:MAG: hypothetical protein HY075_04335, partial [Deltaproteobacteria bacterium]|nr:hypothetical protein [Deltaproteobacteria bacterium]